MSGDIESTDEAVEQERDVEASPDIEAVGEEEEDELEAESEEEEEDRESDKIEEREVQKESEG